MLSFEGRLLHYLQQLTLKITSLMPIYAYKCESCGHAKDVLQKMSDTPLSVCPQCGASAFKKQLTAAGFQLKGSGWYVTDFRGGSQGDPAAKSADAAMAGTPDASAGSASTGDSPAAASASSSSSSPATSTTTPASVATTGTTPKTSP